MHSSIPFGAALAAVTALFSTARAAPIEATLPNAVDARGFSYQNNDVNFRVDAVEYSHTITGGQFVTTDLSISSGQDPQGRNHVAQTYTLNGGNFEFQVGRHKTTPVAQWWASQVSAGETNYGSEPGSLNFAFMGNLQLGFSNGDTIHLDKFALGQGSTDAGTNNWWVGSQMCSYEGTILGFYTRMACAGYDQNFVPVTVGFEFGVGPKVDSIVTVTGMSR